MLQTQNTNDIKKQGRNPPLTWPPPALLKDIHMETEQDGTRKIEPQIPLGILFAFLLIKNPLEV
jgi:hypothetical protein